VKEEKAKKAQEEKEEQARKAQEAKEEKAKKAQEEKEEKAKKEHKRISASLQTIEEILKDQIETKRIKEEIENQATQMYAEGQYLQSLLYWLWIHKGVPLIIKNQHKKRLLKAD